LSSRWRGRWLRRRGGGRRAIDRRCWDRRGRRDRRRSGAQRLRRRRLVGLGRQPRAPKCRFDRLQLAAGRVPAGSRWCSRRGWRKILVGGGRTIDRSGQFLEVTLKHIHPVRELVPVGIEQPHCVGQAAWIGLGFLGLRQQLCPGRTGGHIPERVKRRCNPFAAADRAANDDDDHQGHQSGDTPRAEAHQRRCPKVLALGRSHNIG